MQAFVRGLADTIPSLLTNANALAFLNNTRPDGPAGPSLFPHFVITHGCDSVFLDAFFRCYIQRLFSITDIVSRVCTHTKNSDDVITYTESEYHTEMEFTHKNMPFLKELCGAGRHIIQNRRRIVFLKSTASACCRRDQQKTLASIVDKYTSTTQFVLAVPSLGKIDGYLSSRAMIVRVTVRVDASIPLCFRIDVPTAVYNAVGEILHTAPTLPIVDRIMRVRQLSYKLYHLNTPLEMVCRAALTVLSMRDDAEEIVYKVVDIAATCEHESNISNREVLLFEKFFLYVLKYLEHRTTTPFVKREAVITLQQQQLQRPQGQQKQSQPQQVPVDVTVTPFPEPQHHLKKKIVWKKK